MNEYGVFGGVLRSELSFSELRASDGRSGRPTYTLRQSRVAPQPGPSARRLGEESLGHAGHLRLDSYGDFLRLEHDRGGTFDIHPERGLIQWRPTAEDADEDLARSVVLSRALPVLLHARGRLILHAGGVAMDGRAVAFMAPKGYGKSTLALMMGLRGAGLLSDDTVAVETEGEFRAWPGEGHLKIWDDAAAALGVSLPDREPLARLAPEQTMSGREKRKYLLTVEEAAFLRPSTEPLPVAALYLLAPAAPEEGGGDDGDEGERTGGPIERRRLSSVEASLALVACSKIAPLLHQSQASSLLERATRVAEHVPVYAVRVPRELARLRAVADGMEEWHRAAETFVSEPVG